MPGKKNTSSKTPTDSAEPDSVGASAVLENSTKPIDLMSALAVGTPGLAPVEVTHRGIDFSVRRYFSPEEIWALSDLQRVTFPGLPAGANDEQIKKYEDQIAILLVDNLTKQLEHLIVPENHVVIPDLLLALDTRTRGELNRILQFVYQLAGITNAQGEFLAS